MSSRQLAHPHRQKGSPVTPTNGSSWLKDYPSGRSERRSGCPTARVCSPNITQASPAASRFRIFISRPALFGLLSLKGDNFHEYPTLQSNNSISRADVSRSSSSNSQNFGEQQRRYSE